MIPHTITTDNAVYELEHLDCTTPHLPPGEGGFEISYRSAEVLTLYRVRYIRYVRFSLWGDSISPGRVILVRPDGESRISPKAMKYVAQDLPAIKAALTTPENIRDLSLTAYIQHHGRRAAADSEQGHRLLESAALHQQKADAARKLFDQEGTA